MYSHLSILFLLSTISLTTALPQDTAARPSCPPPPTTYPRQYKLVNETAHCTYQSFVETYTTTTNQRQGIAACKDYCAQEPRCRTFSWFTDGTSGNCWLAADFYDPSNIQCDPVNNLNTYLAVYNVSKWGAPNPLIPNGDFETGCLEPWFFQDFTSDESMRADVIRCGNDCAPNGGKYYVKIIGNGQNGSTRDHIYAYIGQLPGLSEDVQYKVTAWMKADAGSTYRFTYPTHTSRIAEGTTNGQWQKVEGQFTGRNVGTFLLQVDAPGYANFAVDNVKVVKV